MRRKFSRLLLFLLVPVVLLLVVFFIFFNHESPEYIFLITMDTTRADAIDYSTKENTRTPNLAALAAGGQYFENSYSVIPITLPSHAAMFYSLPPHLLKLYNNGQERPIPYPSLAEIMKKSGYSTGAVISLAVLNRDFGLAKGFDQYLEGFKSGLWYKTAAEVNRDAFTLISKLKGKKSFIWLHYSDPHEPYFPPGPDERFTVSMGADLLHSGLSIDQPMLHIPLTLQPGENVIRLHCEIPSFLLDNGAFTAVSYADLEIKARDPRAPITISFSPDLTRRNERYGRVTLNTAERDSFLNVGNKGTAPCPADLSFKFMLKTTDEAKRDGYGKEVSYMDSQIGLLLAHLKKEGIFEKSILLVLGDHGEGLGEYQSHFGHINYLNKIYTHVPFILCGENIPRRGKQSKLVSNFDVGPTILSLIGAKKPAYMTGANVLAASASSPKLFLETYSPEAFFDVFSVVYFPWQVIFYPGRPENSLEFYNLEQDRSGTRSTYNEPDPSGQRSEMVKSVLKISRIITASKRNQDRLNKKTMDTLKSLGYL